MRYFVSFKENTDMADKLMVFVDMTRNDIQDIMQQFYKNQWHKVLSEPEAFRLLKQLYNNKDNWIKFGDIVKTIEEDHSVSLEPITNWFETAKPKSIVDLTGKQDKNLATQLGAHFEEIAEMLAVYKNKSENIDLQNQFTKAYIEVRALSDMLYKANKLPDLTKDERVELFDAVCDQVVTLAGTAYFADLPLDKGLTEVNKSNYSKFEDGKPVLNSDGKIIKGKDYFKPNLAQFL